MKRKPRRFFLLLETMIALALIVLCVFPLLAPYLAMYRAEKDFIRKIDLDHQVNLFYASVLEKLYLNAISWEELMHHQFLLPKEALLAYEGSYNFNEVAPRFKPKEADAPYSLFLFTLTFNFIPIELSQKSDEVKKANTLKYRYEVFVVRDRRPQNGT
jgi:hypothetical protein